LTIVLLLATLGLWLGNRVADDRLPWWRSYTVAGLLGNLGCSYLALSVAFVGWPLRYRRRRLRRVVLVTAGTVLPIAAMELPTLLWRHDWQMTLGTGDGAWWEQVSRRTNRPDPELIHLHWPNSRFRGAIEGNLGVFGIHSPVRYAVDVRYDQHGFRNAEDLQQADVVAIGDSFVEAAIIADGQTVTDRLAARLGRPVANLVFQFCF
jgi:hypothetical protein